MIKGFRLSLCIGHILIQLDSRRAYFDSESIFRGVYQHIDLELGKTHDEYEKQINERIKF